MGGIKLSEYLLSCGIKKNWHGKTLKEYSNDKEALQLVYKYLADVKTMYANGVGLYLWGSNGTGKSHLMNCAFKELVLKGYSVRVYSMDEIIDNFTASWYSDADRHDFYTMLRNVKFLGIDEFGKNVDNLPELVKRAMESIIRYRVQMGKPIWVTSNTDPEKIHKVFSEDVASIMREAVVPVCVRGKDYREKILDNNIKLLQ